MTASRSRVSSDADGIPQCAELDLGQKQRGSLTRVRPADSLPIVLGEQSKGCLKFFGGGLFLKSEFLSRAHTTRYRSGHVRYVVCLGVTILGSNQPGLAVGSVRTKVGGGQVLVSNRFLFLPQPGSHLSRGLMQAPVSSTNRRTS